MARLDNLDLLARSDARINDIEFRAAGITLTDDRRGRRSVPGGEERPVR
jgi:hypothetical protein